MSDRIIENSTRMTLLQVCSFVANTLLYIALARILGPADYGIASITVFPALTLLRTGVFGALMFGTAKVIAANPDALGSCIATSRKAYWIVGAACVVVFLAGADLLSFFLKDITLTPFFRFMSLAVPPVAAFVLFHATLIGLKDFRKLLKFGATFQVLKLTLTVILVLIGTRVYGLVLGFSMACIVALMIFRRGSRPEPGEGEIKLSYYFHTVGAIFLAFLVSFLQRYAGLINLKRIIFDNEQVAFYSVAYQLASMPALIFTGVAVALWPAISGLAKDPDLELARGYINKSLKYTMLGLFPIAAILAALPDYAVRIAFSAKYAQGAVVLPYIVIALVLLTLQSVVMSALLAMGKVKTIIFVTGGASVVIFLLGNILIPDYGIKGAAISEVIGFFLSLAIVTVVSSRIFGRLYSIAEFIKIAASTIVLFLVIRSFTFLGQWAVLTVIPAAILFFLALVLLGVLSLDEIQKGLLRRKREA
ncbi:MAG: oligosaccharide flippase family protein [Candidatus Coatesbacteria bacterium]|nr:oligosaccharide flippase family protein [Candidatus Coatesbacteria bacterium]